MRHLLIKTMLSVIVFLMATSQLCAWTSVRIMGTFFDNWQTPIIATEQPNSNSNVWWAYLDATNMSGTTYYFKILGESDEWTGGNGGSVNVSAGNGYVIYNTAQNGEGNNIEFDHDTKYRGYLWKITWYNEGYWHLEVWAAARIDLRDYANVTHTKSDNTVETRNIIGRGGYKYFCTWSDKLAWKKPDNVDMFVLSNYTKPIDNGNGNVTPASVQLQKLNLNYIPANIGLILAAKETTHESITLEKGASGNEYDFNLLREQVAVYNTNQTATYSGTSMLTPCYEETALPRTETIDGTEYANYLFGFYRSKKAGFSNAGDNDFTLGFWVSNGSGNTYANSAYFRIKLDEAELIGVGTSYDLSAMANAKPCFLLDFPEDETVATGISDALHLNDNEQMINEKGGWYTLDGRRLDGQPTAKGIYRRNGKKFIMK